MQSQPGTDTDVQIIPSYTYTTEDAIDQFEAEDRKCYECNEVRVTFITYNISGKNLIF